MSAYSGDVLVSVLLPVYNGASYLGTALDSIIRQTYPHWELVVVDDGSTDESREIVLHFQSMDPRIRLVQSSHGGIVHALNRGLEACKGPLVARMDADDLSHPKRLAKQVALLNEHGGGPVMIGCLLAFFPRFLVQGGMRYYQSWLNSLTCHKDIVRDMFVECPMVHPSLLGRRELWFNLGGYRDLPWPEDYDLVLRCFKAGVRFAKVDQVLLFVREGSGRISHTQDRYGDDMFRRLKCHFLFQTLLSGVEEVQIWGSGPIGKKWRKVLEERGLRVLRYLDVDPRKIGRQHHGGVPVHHYRELPSHRDVPILGAVGQKGARDEIRAELERMGIPEGREFIFVQ